MPPPDQYKIEIDQPKQFVALELREVADHGGRLGKKDEDRRLDHGHRDNRQSGDSANFVEASPFSIYSLVIRYLSIHLHLSFRILSQME